MKIFARISLILLVATLIFFSASIIRCEIMTVKHLNEFDGLFTDYSSVGWKRVINYTSEYAEVYAVDKEYAGYLTYFEKHNGKWKNVSERCVWSEMGSADDILWPYFWTCLNFI